MVNRQINRRDKDAHRGGFDYRPSDPKKLKERAERRGGGFDGFLIGGVNMFRPKAGENAIRICPPTWKDHDHFGLEVWVHGFIGLERSSYLCPKKMLGKKCPICELAAETLQAGEKEDSDQIKAKMKVLYWLIDREGDSSEPQIWAVSGQFDQDISGRCNKRNGKVLEVDNPWDGHDVTFRRTGQGLNTRYLNVDIDPDTSPLADREKETNRLLEFLKEKPIDSVLKYYGYDHLKGAIEGKAKDEDDEIDERGSRKTSRHDDDEGEGDSRGSKRTSRSRGDDDEPDERRSRALRDDEEDERPRRRDRDEEEERPRSRRRDAEEGEEADDRGSRRSRSRDEEDERPARRSSRDDDDERDQDRGSSRRVRDEDEDDRGGKRRRPVDDDGAEDEGGRGSRNKRERQDDEDDDRPRGKRSRADDDAGDDEPPPSSRRARRNRDDD